MVSLGFGELANFDGEVERRLEILESENPDQLRGSGIIDKLPLRKGGELPLKLFLSHWSCRPFAGYAMPVFELCHDVFSCLDFRGSGPPPAEHVAGILRCLLAISTAPSAPELHAGHVSKPENLNLTNRNDSSSQGRCLDWSLIAIITVNDTANKTRRLSVTQVLFAASTRAVSATLFISRETRNNKSLLVCLKIHRKSVLNNHGIIAITGLINTRYLATADLIDGCYVV